MLTSPHAPPSSNLGYIFIALCVSIAAAVLVFMASPAEARSKPVVYTAELQQPAAESHYIIRGTVIYCDGTECMGAKGHSSAKTMCAVLAEEAGPVKAFAYKGKALDAKALGECNG